MILGGGEMNKGVLYISVLALFSIYVANSPKICRENPLISRDEFIDNFIKYFNRQTYYIVARDKKNIEGCCEVDPAGPKETVDRSDWLSYFSGDVHVVKYKFTATKRYDNLDDIDKIKEKREFSGYYWTDSCGKIRILH